MNSNSKAYEMIRRDIKGTLKNYEKIVHLDQDDENYVNPDLMLQEKLKRIEDKLKETVDIRQDFEGKKEKKNTSRQTPKVLMDVSISDDFRNFNIYIPKIKINETAQNKTTFSLNNNLYEDLKIDDLPVTTTNNNKIDPKSFVFRKLNKTQKYKPDPLFFSNKYIQLEYTDKSEKSINLKRTSDNFIYTALKKKIDENIASSLYIVNYKSPLYNIYKELVIRQERENEYVNRYNRFKEDELVYEPKDENEDGTKKRTENAKSIHLANNRSSFDNVYLEKDKDKLYSDALLKYKQWIKNKINRKLNGSYTSEGGSTSNQVQTKSISQKEYAHSVSFVLPKCGVKVINLQGLENGDERHPDDKYDTGAFCFGIIIDGVIEKIRGGTTKLHSRRLVIDGPIATWYRYVNDTKTNTVKGLFDLRKKENQQDHIRDGRILIHKFQESKNGKELDKKIEFKTEEYEEFSGKSFKEVFIQISKYYTYFNTLKNRVPYEKLKYFSDSKITTLSMVPSEFKFIINDKLEWHYQLKHLTIYSADKNSLKDIFLNLNNSNILLESLILESGMSSQNLSNFSRYDFEVVSSITKYFSSSLCENLVNLKIVNFKFENGIKSLLDCLSLKFSFMKNKSNNFNNKTNVNCEYDIPYRNLTIKKKEHTLPIQIDLNDLYSFFMNMANIYGGINKFKTPFEKLDIGGCETINTDGLRNLINNFKIIKEIDISGTRCIPDKVIKDHNRNQSEKTNTNLQPNSFLINNLDLLRGINIKHHYFETVKNFDGEIMNRNKSQTLAGYDYSNGLLPILNNLYIYDTPITNDTFHELINLFKKLKFFKSFHLSEHQYPNISENLKSSLFGTFTYELHKENENFCENLLELDIY